MTLDDVPHRLSWRALTSFVSNADVTTAIFRRTHPEHYGWTREAYMLADLYDAITNAAAGVMRSNRVKVHNPKPYRRPKPITHKHGAVSVEDFEAGWAAAIERHRRQSQEHDEHTEGR